MSAQDALKALSAGFEALAAQAAKSVFHVGGESLSFRSGVLIDDKHVLVPAAMAEAGERIELRAPDGSTVAAEVKGYDPFSELAVVALDKDFSGAAFELAPKARLGQLALTVAHPSPEGHEVRMDVIRCVGGPTRLGPGLRIDSYLQTDGLPFPGFAGAPVVDLDGKLIGIISSNAMGNASFVIPAAEVLDIAKRLIEHGSPVRGYVGLRTKPVKDKGLLVFEVEKDSPSEKAGIRVGDILQSWDGQVLKSPSDLLEILASWKGSGSVKVVLSRGDASVELNVEPAKRSMNDAGGWDWHHHGGHDHHRGGQHRHSHR